MRAYFEEHPPQNSAEAQAIIEARTSLKRSPTQIREFLKRMGMKLRKTGYVPGKSCEKKKQEAQEEFKKKINPSFGRGKRR